MSVTAQQISKFEAGTNFISSPQLVAFAKALDVPVATLISGVENFLPDGERVTQKDGVMMHNYKTLSPKLQAAFKTLIDSMAIELANNKRSVPNE
jgi:transcriptional regulator with XRE-family HTH domain